MLKTGQLILTLAIVAILIIGGYFINLYQNIPIVAKVISAEACGEGEIGMYLVGNTIKNRVMLDNKTPYQVVTARNQYAGLNNPNRDALYQRCNTFSNMLSIELMSLPDLTDGALYFKRPEEERKPWHKTLTVTYKNHEFYK